MRRFAVSGECNMLHFSRRKILRNHAHECVKTIHYCLWERIDVKPSNVLINKQGQVKMCDFGISGHLVDSVAKTLDAGCKPYMAIFLQLMPHMQYE
ncbi:unnamed protein product [Ranitomeya imitator]|uniref:mitogen-activated protein kinase kinase n=1 Tax=Ranitomeya imitator TaxID=111125 RepID=A0ABN9L9M9_9NEOB|nr:unnamed protein product [Ranitomeya imitator]